MILASLPDDLAGAARPEPPLVVAWNLTRPCRRRCPHCATCAGTGAGAIGELSTVECLHVVHQLPVGDPSLLVLCGGEPLEREDLETIAAHAVRRGARVAVATTGAKLIDRRLDALVAGGISGLVVTLATLQAGRRPSGHHGQACPQDAASAVERARAHEVPVVVSALLSETTVGEAGEIAAWCAERGVAALHLQVDPSTYAGDQHVAAARALRRCGQEIRLALRGRGKRMSVRTGLRHLPGTEGPCPCGPCAARITSDGKLTACPCRDAVLADLRLNSLAQVWESSPELAARREEAAARAVAEQAGEPDPRQQLALDFGAPTPPRRGRAR